MFGCVRRLGCLVLLLVAGGLYLVRDGWWPTVRRAVRPDAEAAAEASVGASPWEPLDQERAARGEQAVRALAARRGPVYVNLRAGELASYAFLSLADAPPLPTEDAQAAVLGDRVYLRSVVSLRELGGVVGGAAARLLPERDTLRLGGTFEVVRPGLAQFHVRDVQLGSFPLPASVIPRLVRRLGAGPAPAGVADGAIAIPLPRYIGDVRVGRGRITLYKATP